MTQAPEIDLNNPIFVYYLDIRGKSKSTIDIEADNIFRYFPKNLTLFLVPSEQPSKIECVFNGFKQSNDKLNQEILSLLNNCLKSSDLTEIKTQLREVLLNQLLNEPE